MKVWSRRYKQILTIAIPAALMLMLALPVSSSHTCVFGTTDYDQCVIQTAGDEPVDVGDEPGGGNNWYCDPNLDGDACR